MENKWVKTGKTYADKKAFAKAKPVLETLEFGSALSSGTFLFLNPAIALFVETAASFYYVAIAELCEEITVIVGYITAFFAGCKTSCIWSIHAILFCVCACI